jgi:hypothetical protein
LLHGRAVPIKLVRFLDIGGQNSLIASMDTRIKHRVIEPKTKGEIWIWAERQLTQLEVSEAVSTYLLGKNGKRPKKGERIEFEWMVDL